MPSSATVRTTRSLREELEAAVSRRHCADHPMTEKWAKGKLGRNAMMGWAVQHYHWVSNTLPSFFEVCARAPKDVAAQQVENWLEETDDKHSHLDIVLRFAKANGADLDAIKKDRGLP